MLRFLFWRLVQSVIVLWAVYTFTFFMLMLTPGDPFVTGDKRPPQAVLEALASKYHLDFLVQQNRGTLTASQKFLASSKAYWFYLGDALHGDLGPSIEFEGRTVAQLIGESLPVSVALGSMALLIALWVGVPAGMLGAVRKNRPADMGLSLLTLVGVSLPNFVVGLLLMMALVVAVPLLPPGGWGVGSGGITGTGRALLRLILPATTLALFFLAYIARLTRSSTLDTLSADFVRTARAKGVAPRTILTRHVGANAALPILSYLGPAAAYVLTGSFVVEKLFTIPGLGQHFVQGCLSKDVPVVLGSVLVYSALVVLFNLLVDLAYALVDPRIVLA